MEGSLAMKIGLFGLYGLGIGSTIGWIISPPSGSERYGSKWHEWQHKYGLFGYTYGQIAYVRAVIPMVGHVNVFGLVCKQCGYVSVARVLEEDEGVEDEVFGRSTGGYTWTDEIIDKHT